MNRNPSPRSGPRTPRYCAREQGGARLGRVHPVRAEMGERKNSDDRLEVQRKFKD